MGTIIPRKRKDGTVGHTALIRIKKGGKVIHTESQTFDRDPAAKAWLKKRETELAQPGALDKPTDPTLADVIDKYRTESLREYGKTRDQVLRTISSSELAQLRCSEIGSVQVIEFAKAIKASPSTVGTYLSHLSSVFTVARPAWGYPLDKKAIDDARVVAAQLGLIAKSKQRTRRPTLTELDQLMQFFTIGQDKRKDAIPMTRLIAFAIFSTRRQEEITRMLGKDLDRERLQVVVRDMKNPEETIGNDVPTTLTPEALRLIDTQPATLGRIWPHNSQSVSANFTRACIILGIDDLHFHDLRHDGISRLFEMGWTIPQVACVSGHRSWTSLKRYTHMRQSGDKYAGWSWLEKLAPTKAKPPQPEGQGTVQFQ